MLSQMGPNSDPLEPKSYEEAMNGPFAAEFEEAMEDELDSHDKNNTWMLCTKRSLPSVKSILKGRWVFKAKRNADGKVIKFKARWVVKGFLQQSGIDFDETFASVVKPMSYKAIFAMAAALGLEVDQMDVKTAFLYSAIKETVYVEFPHGFGDPGLVCKLNKALYGLKQSPRAWYEHLCRFFKAIGFQPLLSDHSVFHNGRVVVGVYVDDILICGHRNEVDTVKKQLNHAFQMSDLGPVNHYLGMKITRNREERAIYLSQATYIDQILASHGMANCHAVHTPMTTDCHLMPAGPHYDCPLKLKRQYQSAVGSLMYAMLGTRPDIAFAVSVVSRFASNPTHAHEEAVKRIFRYLQGTKDLVLAYKGGLEHLLGWTDSDWAGDHDTRRSTSGYVFCIGSGAISWSSKRQATVALSTCEAEYEGQTQATKEAIWLRNLLSQLHIGGTNNPNAEPATVVLYGDNQGAIALAKNPQFHGRTKHVDIKVKFLREQLDDGVVDLAFTPTDEQVADGLTKALDRPAFERFRDALGLQWPEGYVPPPPPKMKPKKE